MSRLHAKVTLVALILIVGYGVLGRRSIEIPLRDPNHHVGDTVLHIETIERIRTGEPYYSAVGAELRKHDYPTAQVVNWRTPLHYEVVAALSLKHASTL